MDIQFNKIILNKQKKSSSIGVQKKVISKKKASKNDPSKMFSFEFGTPQKVKALVARRRPQKNATSDKELPLKPPTKEPLLTRPPETVKENINHTQGEIMLNVFAGAPKEKKAPKNEKHSRFQRMQQKKLKQTCLPKKVLTDKEIDDGIRTFSKKTSGSKDTNSKPKFVNRSDKSVSKMKLFTENPETKILGQRFVVPLTEKIFTGAPTSSVDIHPHFIQDLKDVLNITELTTVQQKTIPEALKGRDILVRSQTGSGKTLAYAIPIVQKLQEIRPKLSRNDGILAVIVVPIRELAIQTYEVLVKLLKPFIWIVPGLICGGERRKAEKARLRKGINILVSTPGRLVDHILHTESFKLDKTKFIVIDEADRMLEMGYERDVKQIIDAINEQRQKSATEGKELDNLQRFLLSATLTSTVEKLAGLTLKDPLFIDNKEEDPTKTVQTMVSGNSSTLTENGTLVIPENLQMNYVIVPPKLRLVTLSGLLAKELKKNNFKAIVFMSSMEMVNFHHDLMNEQLTQKILDDEDEINEDEDDDEDEPLLKGLRFFKLHGSMTQPDRQGVFKAFREAKSGVLLATDVAGRGIDVMEISLIVQYSPPQNISDFVHRVGRTARAGKSGRAILFLAPTEANFIRVLEDKRIRISQVDMEEYLKALVEADSEANNIQEAASNLQHKFQELIAEDNEMKDKACKAFVSWMRFYSTFPKNLKPIFAIQSAHMGHFAKSFGLKDAPSSFARKYAEPKPLPPTNRLTYTERDPEKIKDERKAKQRLYEKTFNHVKNKNKLQKIISTSKSLTTSEFDSGLPEIKRKKR